MLYELGKQEKQHYRKKENSDSRNIGTVDFTYKQTTLKSLNFVDYDLK